MPLSKTFPQGAVLTAADANTHLVHTVPVDGDPYDTGWITLAHPNDSFSNVSGDEASLRRIGNVVYGRGRVTPPSTTAIDTSGVAIGSVPTGARLGTTDQPRFIGSTCTAGFIELVFNTSGTITCRTRGGSLSLASSGYVSLNGVVYVI
jgi:hypothetical protein